jgi:hypothetical protein
LAIAHAAFEHMANAEVPANLRGVRFLLIHGTRAASGSDRDVPARERRDYVLGDGVAEIASARVG